jgi:hypothetical protein
MEGVIALIIIYFIAGFFNKKNKEKLDREALQKKIEENKAREAERAKIEQEKKVREEQEKRAKGEVEYQNIRNKYQIYIEKFCQLAEREVSVLDEWGDENRDVLPKLKQECICRIAKSIHADAFEKDKFMAKKYIEGWFDTWLGEIKPNSNAPFWATEFFNEDLPKAFQSYHEARKAGYKHMSNVDFNTMSGIDFENYIAAQLKDAGYNVSGTPVTGDQGADLIASKNNKVFVIQAKRYSSTVGNEAIQQVVAARNYYKGDVAAVITNSSFTPSAITLAKQNDVILIKNLSSLNLDQSLFI